MQYDRTIYCSLYTALAVKPTQKWMVAADKQPSNALAASPLEKYVMGLGDVH